MTFRILPGLRGDGPPPRQFTYGDKRTHSEGVVVEFAPAGTTSWLGNFQRAIGSYSTAITHPNAHDVIVIAGGEGYVVDPVTAELKEAFGGSIQGLWMSDSRLVIIDDAGIRFSALAEHGWRWHTRRLSWDGFENVTIDDQRILGQAWNAIEQRWQPFSIDLANGAVDGGAYVEVATKSSNDR